MSQPLPKWTPALVDALMRWTGKSVQIDAIWPLAGGACQDNFRVDLRLDGEARRMALRSDANSSLPGSLSRAAEYPVIRAAHAMGVPTANAHWLVKDLLRQGSSAYLMDWCEGVAIGAKVLRDPALDEARAGLVEALARGLAAIHRITPTTHPDLPLHTSHSAIGDRSAIDASLSFTREMIDVLPMPYPAMELAWRWLDTHRPAAHPKVLVHGDFRTGNFMVSPSGLQAVLDWEFSHWGDAHCDLAWIAVRDWRFGRLNKPVGGFASRADFYGAYERASGTTVDWTAVHWWEVLGNLRWASGAVFQAVRVLTGAEADLELLAIGRRASEMEWEALRLIRRGVR
jgi:aminoglycoside phosphotransferase (APT) family kinase protein